MVNPDEGLALKFIEAPIINGTKCAKIERSDIAPEIKYWNQAILEWNENLALDTSRISSLTIWVQFPELDVKYWGVESLSKLGSMIGIPLKIDKQTIEKIFFSYASLLIDIPLEGPFMEYVDYINDKGRVTRQRIKYEWQLVKCDHCSMYGHIEEDCRKKKVVKQEWRMVNQEKEKGQEQQDIPTKFVTPRRTARRPSLNMRGLEEPATNSFRAVLENEILDMVTQEEGAMQSQHG
ncbi:hypothetical protein Cgig2_002969 [Carnegiea gigantea]|uniref:DUF4283 domain-containing protein n=1 Tax=Carnegiea gigantea TaxID=171969 RepID=A0A9Q1GGF6_9CARY|nr:hypothetical protein Cgig2_002969 [Carnegiea gigantea]